MFPNYFDSNKNKNKQNNFWLFGLQEPLSFTHWLDHHIYESSCAHHCGLPCASTCWFQCPSCCSQACAQERAPPHLVQTGKLHAMLFSLLPTLSCDPLANPLASVHVPTTSFHLRHLHPFPTTIYSYSGYCKDPKVSSLMPRGCSPSNHTAERQVI